MDVANRDPVKVFDAMFVACIKLMDWPDEHVSDVTIPFRAVRRCTPDDPVTCEGDTLFREDLELMTAAYEDGRCDRETLARLRLAFAAAEVGNAIAESQAKRG